MAADTASRYCPTCGLHTEAETCPDDGVATVVRARLDADSTVLHAGDTVSGRYRVTGVLGRGGFGAVHSAEHTGTKQKVALKMMLAGDDVEDEEIRRFYREARITASLRHANTVRVFDVGQTDAGALFIAMEMLEGPTLEQMLKDRLAEGRCLTEAEAIQVAIPVLRSLHEAHKKGLVHRDLKPANIMLSRHRDDDDDEDDDETLVKVLDFGIARPKESSLTGEGTALGTPAFMSPEQCSGDEMDGRSDLYSLGVILFMATTGTAPFDDRSALTIMFKHLHEPPPDLRTLAGPALPEDFCEVVMRALAKEPSDRFESARHMRKALEHVRDGLPLAELTSQYRSRKKGGRSPSMRIEVEQDSDRFEDSGTVALPRAGRRNAETTQDALPSSARDTTPSAAPSATPRKITIDEATVTDATVEAPALARTVAAESPKTRGFGWIGLLAALAVGAWWMLRDAGDAPAAAPLAPVAAAVTVDAGAGLKQNAAADVASAGRGAPDAAVVIAVDAGPAESDAATRPAADTVDVAIDARVAAPVDANATADDAVTRRPTSRRRPSSPSRR